MAIKLNHDGYAHALELVKAGKIDRAPEWSISPEEKDAMAGGKDSPDWAKYGIMCLAEDTSEPRNDEAHWKYPFGKDGKAWRKAVIAIKSRAAAQGATDIYDAATKLLNEIDKDMAGNLAAFKAAVEALPAEASAEAKDALAGELRELLAAGARNSAADTAVMQQMMDLLKKLMGDDGGVKPGDAEGGTQEMVGSSKLSEGIRIMAAVGDKNGADYGYRWAVEIVNYGVSVSGVDYPAAVVKAAKDLYAKAPVFAISEGQHTLHPYGSSVRDMIGWFEDVKDSGTGLVATFVILKGAGDWLRDNLIQLADAGKLDMLGFSHDLTAATEPGEGKVKKRAKKILAVDSVDVVYDPDTRTKFLRMVAAQESGGKEHEMLEKLLAALEKARPQEYAKVKARIDAKETVTEEDVLALLAAKKEEDDRPEKCPKCGTKLDAADKFCSGCGMPVDKMKAAASGAGDDDLKAKMAQMEKDNYAIRLRAALAENSDLPPATIEKMKAAYKDRYDTSEETLTAAFRAEREYLEKITAKGTGDGLENILGARVDITSQPERLQAALDRTFRLKVDEDPKLKDVSKFEGLRAAYARITGDTNVTGLASNFSKEYLRMCAAAGASGISTSSFPILLGNTLYRRMMEEYRRVTYALERITSFTRRANDYKTLQSINMGYFNDPATIDPQLVDYPEVNSSAIGEDVVNYNIILKGWILSITRKTILDDDLNAVEKLVKRVGRAFIRGRAKNAWNLLINNTIYEPDGLPVFHAAHGNLSTSPIGPIGSVTQAEAAAAITAMIKQIANQTEPASGEVIGMELFKDTKLCLVVSYADWDAAKILNQSQYLDNSFKANPVYHAFGENNENIECLPFLTDPEAAHTNDFYVLGDPSEREMIEAAYLNGIEEPQFFVADLPTVGQMFTADKIQYKTRHEYNDAVVEFRNMTKSVNGN